MTELEKLEKELLEEIQEEPEIYADTEEFCTINPETRIITVPTSKRILGTESDQETNRLYFKCPKVVGDNIDLSLFSLRINYQNAGNKKDKYLVEDVKEEGDNITFSWLLKRNVTAYKGNVKFILCAVKTTEDGIIKNEWNTTLNTECESLEGMEVDKVAVEEETKDIVEQLIAMMNHSAENAVRAVEEAKAEVDKEVGDFALKAQQALADVNNAGQTQTERVQSAGTTAVENIQTTQGTATEAVETAKSEAVQAIQAEGTTQVGNVSAEGEKQVQAVQGAAQEIVADREQIAKNATDIADLKQGKADAIVETASGTLLNIRDGADAFFEDFKLLGKTVQDGTPTPDTSVEIVNAGESGNIEIKVTGKNLIDEKEIYKTDVNYFISYKKFGGKGIDLKAGTPYTFSVNKNVDGMYIHLYSDTEQELVKIYRQQKLTYKPEKDVKVQLLLFREKKMIEGTTTQLEIGTIATAYEPYREPQEIALQLNSPLTKWDRLEKREGIWGIAKKAKKVILTGNENFEKLASTRQWLYYCAFNNEFYVGNTSESVENIVCNYFESSSRGWMSAEDGILGNNKTIIISLKSQVNLEEFKTMLREKYNSGKPVEIYATLSEETWEPLPEEMQLTLNALHTNYPTTIVTNSEDTEMQITYVADTKNYYLNREQVLQKQILEIQNALISQKISGGGIKVTDSAKFPLQNLRIFGKSEQNGVPSLDAPVPIVNVGEKGNVDIKINTGNLFDINTVKKYEVDNTTLSLSVSGNKIIFNSKISTGKEAIVVIINKLDDMLRLLPGKYTLSYNSNKPFGATNGTDTVEMFVCIHNNGSTRFHSTGNKNWTQFEIKEGDRTYLRFDINKSGQSAEFYDIMLNHGESVLPYEPYFNQSLTLSTPNGLPGIKVDSGGNYTDATGQQWICDEIDLARGKYIQRIGKYIFIGSEPVSEQSNRDGYTIPIAKLEDNILENKSYLSNRFIFSKKAWVNDGEFGLQAGVMFIVDKNFAHFNSPDGLKTFLKDNETYIIYPLIRPIETDLPQETITAFKSLYTNYPSTVISNDENAGMEVSYVADTKHYIDKKFEELNQAIVNTQIALL